MAASATPASVSPGTTRRVIRAHVIRVGPGGEQAIVFEENDPEQLQRVEEALQGEGLRREHLDNILVLRRRRE